MTIRYYIYISDAKVDMLFAQIPRNILKKISADLNINLGVISVTLKERQSEQTRFDKVKVVSKYIENHLEVGDVDYPKSYFKATVPARWGSLRDRLVYFGGKTRRTIFLLGGSRQYIVGEQKVQDAWPSGSRAASIFGELIEAVPDSRKTPAVPLPSGGQSRYFRLISDHVWDIENQNYPEEQVEFLAKRLIEGTLDSGHVLLGTPIYVVYAD